MHAYYLCVCMYLCIVEEVKMNIKYSDSISHSPFYYVGTQFGRSCHVLACNHCALRVHMIYDVATETFWYNKIHLKVKIMDYEFSDFLKFDLLVIICHISNRDK